VAGADAVHPGYGFLAESSEFARSVLDAGLVWVGPSPEVIGAMGSKIEARRLMAAAGVPVVPGADTADARTARMIGFPLLVKAAAGGGGRGMRRVDEASDLDAAIAAASREASASFGDGTVYLERLLSHARHIEVQIFGDITGTVIHLGERDCSVQRRHQKVIEETPAAGLDPSLRELIVQAGVDAATAVGYTGAGTVEFLVDFVAREFFFLEMNTRLQVEHPITEAVTGLDLVRLQIVVAEGEPLPPQESVRFSGHAIEARLYAEDPYAGYAPSPGLVHRFEVPTAPGIRVDAGIGASGAVPAYYDPLLAKVVVQANSRDEAVRLLHRSLQRSRIHGITTNRDLLTGILAHPEFAAGTVDTTFLDRNLTETRRARDPEVAVRHAAVAALAAQATARAAAPALGSLPSGFRNLPTQPQRREFGCNSEIMAVAYRFTGDGLNLTVDGKRLAARLHDAGPHRVDIEFGGIRRTYLVEHTDMVFFVDGPDGSSELHEVPRFPEPEHVTREHSLVAPMPGSVIAVHVSVGDDVDTGDPLVTLEAMKMEHTVTANGPGRVVAVAVSVNGHVDPGQILVEIE
jgi:acetyl/propionyl-CoA carboxylase alpha subunit